jgi:hypothetical protein
LLLPALNENFEEPYIFKAPGAAVVKRMKAVAVNREENVMAAKDTAFAQLATEF